MPARPRICLVATVPFAVNAFFRVSVDALSADYAVTVVTNGRRKEIVPPLDGAVKFESIAFARPVAILHDLRALVRLWRLFRRERFLAVHSMMPKTGLLAMVAARLAGVPLRFHTFTGQVWATRQGLGRRMLMALDRVLVANATAVLADSASQAKFLIDQGIVSRAHLSVLENGSVCGVDLTRFSRNEDARYLLRSERAIPEEAVLFLFLGRLNRDKGIRDLLDAFGRLAAKVSGAHLVIAGPDEESLTEAIAALALRFPGRVHNEGLVQQPEDFLSAADVLCLPSYREGFGQVILEAASAGVPAIASRIYGITDAVVDHTTGLLHDPGDVVALELAMHRLAVDGPVRARMGTAARARAVADFSQERVTAALQTFYREHSGRVTGRAELPRE